MNTTNEPGQLGGQSRIDSPARSAEQPIRPEENPLGSIAADHRGRMQQRITLLLVALLALVVVLTAILYATAGVTHLQDSDVRDFMNHFAPTLLTLLGTAIGFYFGEQRRDQ